MEFGKFDGPEKVSADATFMASLPKTLLLAMVRDSG